MLRDAVPSAAVCVPVEGLSHLEVRYTRSGRTGLATFYANQVIATSSLLMDGAKPEADAEVQAIFLKSLRRSVPTADAFGELTEISDRPLHAVVSWANPEVSDEDEELVQQLSTHFAAAFLLGLHGA
jgi:hypothetical protein